MAKQAGSPKENKGPFWTKERREVLDKLLKLSLRIALILVSVSACFLAWTIWRLFHLDLDPTTVLLVGAILAIALIVWAPKLQILRITFGSEAERFSAENEARKIAATLVGGLAIFLSFYTAQKQLGVQQQAQFTDRYTKAIDEISASDDAGNPKLAVRIGGLYVLEQIMDSSEEQHASILDVLCGYIRDNSLQKALKPSNGPRADIRVALTVLGRRHRDLEVSAQRKKGLRLLKAMLFQQNLASIFRAEYAPLHLDFSGSDLSHVDLRQLVLSGADFSGARLSDCRALLADFSEVSFVGADLSGCVIASTLTGADFRGANLEGAMISGRISGVRFQNANVELSIWFGADFEHPSDIQAANGWEKAFYNPRDLAALGLPPDHNVELVRKVRASAPTATTENKMRLALVLKSLEELSETPKELRQELEKAKTLGQPTN